MDYQQIVANVVLKNIKNFGTERTLRKSVSTAVWTKKYNPVESKYYWQDVDGKIVYEEPSATVQDNQIDMVKDNVSNKIVDGQTIKKGDVVFYMGPNIEPVENDLIIDDAVTYKIYKVDKVQPASIVLLYTCYARS